jgi:hypothetical protein
VRVTLDLVGENNAQTFIQRLARGPNVRKVCPSQIHLSYPAIDLRLREGYLLIMSPQQLDNSSPDQVLVLEELNNISLLDLHFVGHFYG